jgi:hypothetical protein
MSFTLIIFITNSNAKNAIMSFFFSRQNERLKRINLIINYNLNMLKVLYV